MEIKINFEEIFWSFNSQDLNSNTQVSTSQASDLFEPFSQNNKYKMKLQIFEDSFEKSQKNKDIEPRTPPILSSSRTEFHQQPGERLYYQSKDFMNKKKQQYQRIRLEKANEEEMPTFRPMINKNTDKILKNRCKNHITKKSKETYVFPTSFKKQQQQFTHCTFTPQLSVKSQKMIPRKEKDKIFEQLYFDQKFKEVRKKIKLEESNNKPKQKKLSKQQFQKFMERTNLYMSRVQKKNELLIQTSNKYDLETGNKLFSPQINTSKTHQKYIQKRNTQKSSYDSVQLSHNCTPTETKKALYKTQEQQTQDQNQFKPNKTDWIKIFKDSQTGHMKEINEDEEEQKSESEENFTTVKCLQPAEHESSQQPNHLEQSQVQIVHQSEEEKSKDDNEVSQEKHADNSPLTPPNNSEQEEVQNKENGQQIKNQQEKSMEEQKISLQEDDSKVGDPQ